MIEYKEYLKYPDTNVGKRWIFPLPHPHDDFGRNRGLNIASTAMQLDWSFEAEELNISPITHPEIVLDFIHRWPGLFDCCKANPNVLAMYAPQITIPGFDAGFEDVFDKLLISSGEHSDMFITYGRHDTIDNVPPLCPDVIAMRHKTFGNYTPEELGRWYFEGYSNSYVRSHLDVFQGLVWLSSSDSKWLPIKEKNTLIEGIINRNEWFTKILDKNEDEFTEALYNVKGDNFKLSKRAVNGLIEHVLQTLENLGLSDDPTLIVNSLLERDLIGKYFTFREKFRHRRQEIN